MAKKSFKPDYNACVGKNRHENFGSIYESMVKSEQFRSLSNPAKLLYVYCRIQQKSSSGKACLHNHGEEEGIKYPESCFVFPAKQQLEYGLQRTNSQRYFNELIEKGFDKDVIAEFMKLLANAPFTLDYVKEICKDNEYVASLAHIIDTANALADGKYAAEYDMTLVRGQGYYTGTVFEVESLDFNSSIAGGGRYDNLIGKFLKEQIPAVGFSIGFERIYSILMEKEAYKTEKQKKVVLIYEEDQIADAIRYAENLRKTYKTALYIKPKKLGKFLNKLEEQGFDGFQVFGRDEEVRMFGE